MGVSVGGCFKQIMVFRRESKSENLAVGPGSRYFKAGYETSLQFFANVYRTRQTIVPRGVPQPLLISPCPARVLPTASDGSRPKTIALQ